MFPHLCAAARRASLLILASIIAISIYSRPLVGREIKPLIGPASEILWGKNSFMATADKLYAYVPHVQSIFESMDGFSWVFVAKLDPPQVFDWSFEYSQIGDRFYRVTETIDAASSGTARIVVVSSPDWKTWNTDFEIAGSFSGVGLKNSSSIAKPYSMIKDSTGEFRFLHLHEPTSPTDPQSAVSVSPPLSGIQDYMPTPYGWMVLVQSPLGTKSIYHWQNDHSWKELVAVPSEYTFLTYWPEKDRLIVNEATAVTSMSWELNSLLTTGATIPTISKQATRRNEKYLCPSYPTFTSHTITEWGRLLLHKDKILHQCHFWVCQLAATI